MAPGLIALIVALAAAVATGLAWRRVTGRVRDVGAAAQSAGPVSAGAQATGPLPVGQSDLGRWSAQSALTAAQLGRPLGERATLVQFSSAFCAPCRATRRVVAEVAGLAEGVVHAEVDAPSRLDLVRAFRIYVTPTVLVLAPDGRVVNRVSGQPRKTDLIAALGHVVTAANSK